jgi:hypothetical protein
MFWAAAASSQPEPSEERRFSGGISSSPVVESNAAARYVLGDSRAIYYVVDRRPVLRGGPGTGASLGRLDFRRGVRIASEQGAWYLAEDIETGRQLGWVERSALSNVWILIDKRARMLTVYRGSEVFRQFPIDVSQNPNDDKIRLAAGDADHYRIPEGSYFVTSRNPNSQYYLSFMLNYPNADDADRGLAQGLISRAQHRSIVEAERNFAPPPMGTALGGGIAIHGQGSGRQRAWTRGCAALRDVHMDLLWGIVQVGTPVFIR